MTNLPPLISNVFLSALAAVFVFIGTFIYVWDRVPPPEPGKNIVTPPAVLSINTDEPVLTFPFRLPKTLDLTPPDVKAAQSVVNELGTAIRGNDVSALSTLLSSDLASIYPPEEIQSAQANSGETITSYKPLGEPNVTGDFADQVVEITTGTGTHKFQVFLKKESGIWKLMGTEPIL